MNEFVTREHYPELIIALNQARAKLEVLSDGRKVINLAAGERSWEMVIDEVENWVRMRVRIAPLANLTDDQLLLLLKANAGLGPARLAADEHFVMLCAEYPTKLGAAPFLVFARLVYVALDDVVTRVLPDVPGVSGEPVAFPPNGQYDLTSIDGTGWKPPQPMGTAEVDGVQLAIDCRDEHQIVVAWTTDAVPTDGNVTEFLLRWQEPNFVVKLALAPDHKPALLVKWPLKLVTDGLLGHLCSDIAALAGPLEEELRVAREGGGED